MILAVMRKLTNLLRSPMPSRTKRRTRRRQQQRKERTQRAETSQSILHHKQLHKTPHRYQLQAISKTKRDNKITKSKPLLR
jgi:hypothetical protein